jgi:tetratricopeptide (TPR) repeat protein/tRNA A-37 threonylcarbamoyl transferase component Bud32
MTVPSPSPSAADRNLLFGILALQADLIDRDALIAAMNAWAITKATPLGQILLDQGALDPDGHALVEALVRKSVARHGDAQQSLAALGSSVDSACGQLRQQLSDVDVQVSLGHVGAARAADSWMTVPPVPIPPGSGPRFRILRPHAKGGLGEVFVALDEELHREVALKEIQDRHADSLESRARFVLEAEITGGLEHPGIVPVYGLGINPDGRPFYAMRFIKGDSLQDAISRFHGPQAQGLQPLGFHSLAIRQLLRRFVDVCNAVGYAHSRGVLHRDLKPGNVMVGKYGETLVVDWGLAKVRGMPEGDKSEEQLLRPASASGTAETLPGSAIGTPQYMSPEQAAGRLDELGPGSDVYSLGATLYCLLTGKPPFPDPREAGLGEVLQKVQRGEFPPPRQVRREVPAALSAICLKAMSLRPAERYATPRALADDVERWLADEAVTAWRGPWWVRLARWGRRHRPLVTGAAVLLVTALAALSLGVVLLGRKQAEVTQERNAARTAKDQAEAINKFLVEDLLAAARPEELGKDVPMRKVLDKAAQKVETSFEDQPEVEAAVRLAIGDSYRSLGLYKDADPHLRRALDLRTEHLGPEDPLTLKAVNSLCLLLIPWGKLGEAEPLCRDNLETRRRVLGPEHPDTLWSLHLWAYLLENQEQYAEAERLNRECLEARRRVLGAEHRETMMTAHNLAQALCHQDKLDEAETMHRQNLEMRRRVLGPEDPHTTYSRNDLALVLWEQTKLEEAEALFRQNNAITLRIFGADHKEQFVGIDNLARLLNDRGKHEEAERLGRQNLANRRRVLGAESPDTLLSMANLAWVLVDRGKQEEAGALFREALDTAQRAFGPDDARTLNAMDNLAYFLELQGQLAEAEKLFRKTLETRRRVFGPDHNKTVDLMWVLARVLAARGNRQEAETLLRQRVEINKRVLGPEARGTLVAINNLAASLMQDGKWEEAETLFRQLLETRRRILGPDHRDTLVTTASLGNLLAQRGKLDDAERVQRQALDGCRRTLGLTHRDTQTAMGNFAWLLEDRRQFTEAEQLRNELVSILTRTLGAENPATLSARSELARMKADQNRPEEAERLYRELLEIQRRVLGAKHADTLWTLNRLASALTDQAKPDQAETFYREALAVQRKDLPAGHKDLAPTLAGLGRVLTMQGKAKVGELLLREAVEVRRKTLPKDDWMTAMDESHLGGCLTALGRYAEAETLLVHGYEKMRATAMTPTHRLRQAIDRVIALYDAWNKPAEAAKWRARLKEADKPAEKRK